MKESAHVAYDAYGQFTDWKNFAGNPMPQWHELPERIQGAWRAAIAAVFPGDADDETAVNTEPTA